MEQSDLAASRRRLRVRRERPRRRRATEQRDERAAPHGCLLLRLKAAHYHTVAQETPLCITAKIAR
jgi:hypothetical protein